MRTPKWIVLFTFIILCGCWDRTEINDLAFVTGTSLDLLEDGTMSCSLQIAIPTTTETGNSTKDNERFFIISAEGKNGNEIHQKLQKKISRTLFLSHRSIIFIGERLAKHGIKDALDIFTHDPRNRLKTYIMIVKGEEGRSILQINYPLKQLTIEAVKEIGLSGEDLAVTLRDFFISSVSEGVHPVVGGIEPDIHSKGTKNQNFNLTGAGVFKDYKLLGFLNEKEALGMMWLTDKLKSGRITANLPKYNGEVGMRLIHANRKIIMQTMDDTVKFKVQLEGEGSLIENTTGLNINEPKDLKIVKSALEDATKKQVQNSLFKIQKKYKVDSIGFGREVHKNNPEKWAVLKKQWDENFPEIDISLDVKLVIKGTGMVNSFLELPEKENEK
ncbi:Ger(x)C family spore germination protein [Paenibacillus sp. NPDC058071]|uniref:Ger(x)C family spore germination protein n=1 Tax=Paenibacillus sp. NPDC058071 TaxID=3346326 RepID=UPI0036DC1D04